MSVERTVQDVAAGELGAPLVEREITTSPTQTLVEAAADAGIVPQDGPVLNEYLDGDALNRLIGGEPEAPPRVEGAIVVDVWDHVAVVSPDRIAIYGDPSNRTGPAD
jgi:hypothetical protein